MRNKSIYLSKRLIIIKSITLWQKQTHLFPDTRYSMAQDTPANISLDWIIHYSRCYQLKLIWMTIHLWITQKMYCYIQDCMCGSLVSDATAQLKMAEPLNQLMTKMSSAWLRSWASSAWLSQSTDSIGQLAWFGQVCGSARWATPENGRWVELS